MNSFKGKVEKVFDVQVISEKFQKREFVLKTERDGQYGPIINFVKFQAVQEKTSIIDQFPVGTEIEVFFDLKGREWTKDGVTSYFTNIEAWKIEPVVAETATPPTPAATPAATPPPQPGLDSFGAGTPPEEGKDGLPF